MTTEQEFHPVDKLIEIEARIEELYKRAAHFEHIMFKNSLYGGSSLWAAARIEARIEELHKRTAYFEHIMFKNSLYGGSSLWAAARLDEIDSELCDLQETLKQL